MPPPIDENHFAGMHKKDIGKDIWLKTHVVSNLSKL